MSTLRNGSITTFGTNAVLATLALALAMSGCVGGPEEEALPDHFSVYYAGTVVDQNGVPLAYNPQRTYSLCVSTYFRNVKTHERAHDYDCYEAPGARADFELSYTARPGQFNYDFDPADWELTGVEGLSFAAIENELDWDSRDASNCRRNIWFPVLEAPELESPNGRIFETTLNAQVDTTRLQGKLEDAFLFKLIEACKSYGANAACSAAFGSQGTEAVEKCAFYSYLYDATQADVSRCAAEAPQIAAFSRCLKPAN